MTITSAPLRIGAVAALAAAIVGCGGSSATPSPTPEPTLAPAAFVVEASEFKFVPPELTIPATGSTTIELAAGARYLGWEILCLGRTGSGERFTRGACNIATEIRREGKLLWLERGRIEGGGELLASPAGFGGRTVCATLLATGEIDTECLAECRRVPDVALTRLPGLLVARYLGDSSEAAKRCLVRIWSLLRPALIGRAAVEPRIWST